MIKEIADLERLESCARELKRRRFRPGFDNMDAAAALLWLQINGKRLSDSLMNGSYEVMPAIGFRVAKRGGKYRQLSRLTRWTLSIM